MVGICHVVKLVRNIFGTKGKFFDKDGQEAKWDHIVRLERKQSKEEKLHSANKLTKAHIQFDKNKMKVSLAVQTLSSSVTSSLEHAEKNDKHN